MWNFLGIQMTFFRKAIEDMASESLRCVAIAYRSYQKEKVPTTEEQLAHWSLPEEDLVLLAIVGLKVCFVSRNTPIIVVFVIFFYLYIVLSWFCFSIISSWSSSPFVPKWIFHYWCILYVLGRQQEIFIIVYFISHVFLLALLLFTWGFFYLQRTKLFFQQHL